MERKREREKERGKLIKYREIERAAKRKIEKERERGGDKK